MILAVGLLLLAVVLVVAELAFPSFGILGVAAATAYAFALVTAFENGATAGWTFVGLGVVLLPVAIGLGLKLVPLTPIGRKLFLAAPAPGDVQRGTIPKEAAALAGARGHAVTDLRPAGSADIGGRRVDVVAGGGRWIARGTSVTVTHVDGSRIVVEPVPGPSQVQVPTTITGDPAA